MVSLHVEPKLRNRGTHTENGGLPEVGVGGEWLKGVQTRRDKVRALGWNTQAGNATSCICELLRAQVSKGSVQTVL